MSRALRTQAAVSPVSRAGTGPSASSPAHLAPSARAAGSSAPTASLGRPVSQTLGTVRAVTLAGWGPGKGPACSVWGAPSFRILTPAAPSGVGVPRFTQPSGACHLAKPEGREMGADEALGRVLFQLPATQTSCPLLPSGSSSLSPIGFAPSFNTCLYLSFIAEDPQWGPNPWGKMGRAPYGCRGCPVPHSKSCLTSGVKTPALVAPLGKAVAQPAPPVFRGLVML